MLALCEKWEVERRGDRHGHGHRPHAGAATASELVGDMPVRALVDDCPLYDLQPQKPGAADLPAAGARRCGRRDDRSRRCWRCSARPNIASRRPLFEQYDCDRAVAHGPPARAGRRGRARAAGDGSALAVSIDGNGRRVAADPYRGTIEAALECAANLACVGAEPLGTTNNLNFGNPEKPHIAWQLTEAVRGLGEACRALRRADRRRQRLALQRGRRRARSTRRR